MTTTTPLSHLGTFTIDVKVPGRPEAETLQPNVRRVSPGYLDVIGEPLVTGRAFRTSDDATAPEVAIVNETFARRVFGEVNPVGRTIALPLGEGERVPYRIVGVAADIRNAGLRSASEPEILVPFEQSPWVGMSFLARAPRAGPGLLERMQKAVWAADPSEAITRAYRLQEDLEGQLAQVIFFTRMLGGFAVLALLLAAFGTYSVFAFLQRRRTTEIGVRLALGAQPAAIAKRVLAQGMVLAIIAGIAGSLAAVAVLSLLGNQLFGIDAASPLLYVYGISGVLLAALLASIAPAWRAAKVQPMAALRYE